MIIESNRNIYRKFDFTTYSWSLAQLYNALALQPVIFLIICGYNWLKLSIYLNDILNILLLNFMDLISEILIQYYIYRYVQAVILLYWAYYENLIGLLGHALYFNILCILCELDKNFNHAQHSLNAYFNDNSYFY